MPDAEAPRARADRMEALRTAGLTAILVLVFLFLVHPILSPTGFSADLLAMWLAGQSYTAGDLAAVYPAQGPVFAMQPPAAWADLVAGMDPVRIYYPYVYPPLWAALIAPLTDGTSFATFERFAGFANGALMMAALVLAARAARPMMGMVPFVALGILAISASTITLLALGENQPQILVTFLLVLTVERDRAGDSRTAGIALAVAAALKVYPAFFVLIFVLRRDWTAVGAFTLGGAALAAASVTLAGWPLHQVFLDQLAQISRTVLMTGNSYNLNAVFTRFLIPADQLVQVLPTFTDGLPRQGNIGWRVFEKHGLWQMSGALAIPVVVAAFGASMRGRPDRRAPLWVATFTVIALISPIAWAFYYIPAILFVPMILDRLGVWRGGALVVLTIGATVLGAPGLLVPVLGGDAGLVAFVTGMLAVLAVIYGTLPGHSARP